MKQKDVDPRWTKKNGKSYYGYKDHIKADEKSKLIDSYSVTDASVHDSQETENLLEEEDKGQGLHADSAYSGKTVKEVVDKYEMKNHIHEKGYRNTPLTDEQKENNHHKSKTRARVEHIFGFLENSMNGSFIRTIGIKRATAVVGTIKSFEQIPVEYELDEENGLDSNPDSRVIPKRISFNQINEPEKKKKKNSTKSISCIKFVIEDINRDTISVSPTPQELIKNIQECRNATRAIFNGTVFLTNNNNYEFFLKEIDLNVEPIHLVMDKDTNLNDIKEKVNYYKKNGGIRNYIKTKLVESLRI